MPGTLTQRKTFKPRGFSVDASWDEVVLHRPNDAEVKRNALSHAKKNKYRCVTRFACGALKEVIGDFRRPN